MRDTTSGVEVRDDNDRGHLPESVQELIRVGALSAILVSEAYASSAGSDVGARIESVVGR